MDISDEPHNLKLYFEDLILRYSRNWSRCQGQIGV